MITVSPIHFADQMACLAQAGYTTVGAAQLTGFLAGEPLPPRSVVLTFDDGYLDNWVHAHPVLQKHGFTALCFLVSAWPGEGVPRPNTNTGGALPELLGHREADLALQGGKPDCTILRWSEIEAMRCAGTFEFHSHTHSHVRWDIVGRDREAKCIGLRRDLISARAAFEARMGYVSDHLCWPQGFYDDDYRRIARDEGFRHFYTCEMAPNVSNRDAADEHSIYRLEVRDKPASWLASRLWVHSRPLLSRAYLGLKR